MQYFFVTKTSKEKNEKMNWKIVQKEENFIRKPYESKQKKLSKKVVEAFIYVM